MTTDKRIMLMTCSSVKEARKIARAVVNLHLAACTNIVTAPVLSIYRWQGRVESAREVLVIIKTTRKCLAGLQRAIRRLHSYDVPEIIALEVASGSREYLAWIEQSVRAPNRRRKAR